MTQPNNPARVTAQIACEAIINHPDEGYTLADMSHVFEVAVRQGVARFYTEEVAVMIAKAVREARYGMGA